MELHWKGLDTHGLATSEVDPSNGELATYGGTPHEALVLRHVGLVRRMAYYLARRLPRHVEIEDLIQAGMLGLLEAAQRHHASASSFDSYAAFRIRGAILDYVRKLDWRPRSLGRRLREIEKAKSRIENETGASAKPADVAATLGWSNTAYYQTLRDAAIVPLLSLDDPSRIDGSLECAATSDHSINPADKLEKSEISRLLVAAIEALPENERVILLSTTTANNFFARSARHSK